MYQRLYYARPRAKAPRSRALLLVLAIPVTIFVSYVMALTIDIASAGNAPEAAVVSQN